MFDSFVAFYTKTRQQEIEKMTNTNARTDAHTNANETNVDHRDMSIPSDPNAMIELKVVDLANANRNPASRWGRVQFDKDGCATIKVPLKDVGAVHNLHWLSVDDQERYLGLSQEVVITATTSEMHDLQMQLDACKGANMRLAQRNAELEANVDMATQRLHKEFSVAMEDCGKNMDRLRGELERALVDNTALVSDNDSLKQQISSMSAENDSLKQQISSMSTPLHTTPPHTGEDAKAAAKAAKAHR